MNDNFRINTFYIPIEQRGLHKHGLFEGSKIIGVRSGSNDKRFAVEVETPIFVNVEAIGLTERGLEPEMRPKIVDREFLVLREGETFQKKGRRHTYIGSVEIFGPTRFHIYEVGPLEGADRGPLEHGTLEERREQSNNS